MARKKRKKRIPKSERKKKSKDLPLEEEYTYDRSPPKIIRVSNYDAPLEDDEEPLEEEDSDWIDGEYPDEDEYVEERYVAEPLEQEEEGEEYVEEKNEEEPEALSREELLGKLAEDEILEREEEIEEEYEEEEEEPEEEAEEPLEETPREIIEPETEEERSQREQRLEELKTYWDNEDEEDDFDGYPIVVKGATVKDPRLDKEQEPPPGRERKIPKQIKIDPQLVEEESEEEYEEYYEEEYEEEEHYEEESPASSKEIQELRREMNAMKRRHRRFRTGLILSIVMVLLGLAAVAWFFQDKIREYFKASDKGSSVVECIGIEPDFETNVPLGTLVCKSGVVGGTATLEDILLENKVDFRKVVPLMKAAKKQKVTKVALGSPYAFFHEPKKPEEMHYFVYQSGPSVLVWLDLSGKTGLKIQKRRSLGSRLALKTVIIKDNMAETMYNLESGLEITRMLEEALKWQVDFYYLASGDRFDLVYEEEEFEGGGIEIGDLRAVRFQSRGEDIRAYRFEEEGKVSFYDGEGKAVKREFLQAPVRFGYISSPFDYKRPDPFSEEGEIRPHLGTDYAAPAGTPIMAVADGVVEAAAFTATNGNYVKIRHDQRIQTQYLHMRNFSEGIRYGTKVRQGDIIGFVGNTGRSTGPHVCFRFWKNGVQVDPRNEKPSQAAAEALPEEEMDLYKAAIRKARDLLLQ